MSLRDAVVQLALTLLILLAVAELMRWVRDYELGHRLLTFVRTGRWDTL